MTSNIAEELSINRKALAGILCWIEIPADDILACKNFYNTVFPSWNFTAPTASVPFWSFEGPAGLCGSITQAPPEYQNEVDDMIKMAGEAMVATISQCVDSIDELVESQGGEARSAKELGVDGCCYMLFKDLDGNRFSVYEKSGEGSG